MLEVAGFGSAARQLLGPLLQLTGDGDAPVVQVSQNERQAVQVLLDFVSIQRALNRRVVWIIKTRWASTRIWTKPGPPCLETRVVRTGHRGGVLISPDKEIEYERAESGALRRPLVRVQVVHGRRRLRFRE